MSENPHKFIRTLYKDVTQQFNADILKTKNYFETYRRKIEGYMSLNLIISPFKTIIQKLEFFKSKVGTGKEFDLKYKGNGYSYSELGYKKFAVYNDELWNFDDFGNYNYGVAARAFGLPLFVALAGAGYNQTFQTRTPDFFNPFDFFDHKRDTYMIIRGYNRYDD